MSAYKICDMIFADPLGYNEDIQMVKSSCCRAAASKDHFCIECGNRSTLFMHGRTGEKRPEGEAEIVNAWNDDEDGSLWECKHCGESFITYTGAIPNHCANCGIKREECYNDFSE